MPTLDWIGKDKVINHHLDVPYRVLERQYSYDENGQHSEDNGSENMIIHGDNLSALKSLLPQYEGRIKCIYIDPPYNTAHSTNNNQRWVYNDNVDHPQIKAWLGQVVGDEGEDLSRHDKWLCMMYPRLKLLQKLLSKDGVIFISIDTSELFNLKTICDEVFGKDNFISLLSIENNPKGRKNSNFISVSNEYVLIYAKDKTQSYFVENVPKNASDLSLDENGIYVHNSGKRVLVGENSFNDVVEDYASEKHYSVYYRTSDNSMCLRKEMNLNETDANLIQAGYERFYSYNDGKFVLNTYSANKFEELFSQGALDFKNGKIYEKNFSTVIRLKSIVANREYNAIIDNTEKKFKIDVKTTSAGQELKKIFGAKKIPFENPKNIGLINLLLTLFEDKKMIVLDSFAGSGTTAHAILNLNHSDGGNRKFILVELMEYADTITAERVKRVINGYGKNEDYVDGVGGNFSYYELGDTLMNGDELNEAVGVDRIREYVYFTETKSRLAPIKDDEPYYLGTHISTAYYFYYDRENVTTLSRAFLHTIKTKTDSYVIYADLCTLSDAELEKYHITFKKIPRDITKL